MTTVLAISGSRRAGSHTRSALRYALDVAAEAGAGTDLVDLGAVDLPLFHPDGDDADAGDAVALLERVRGADAVLLGSPVYHGSYSSTLKNFHDYCSKSEYEGTVVGLVAVAGGGSYGPALEHMRSTVRNVHGWVVPEQVGIRRAHAKFEGGTLRDDDVAARVTSMTRQVLRSARAADGDPVAVD
jgi:NAD(P)H-dependent FMN reductase